jgi:teichuronic acid biosynthesis glycosyltransferase TuaC
MKVLVVMNFGPDESAPHRGRWVVDQVEATRSLGVEVELYSFKPGKSQYLPAIREIRSLLREGGFDLVHAHFGLAGWCALLAGARPLVVTYHGTDVRHPVTGRLSRLLSRRTALNAPVSSELLREHQGRPGIDSSPGRTAILPCGPDLSRFTPSPRDRARHAIGLEPDGRYIFFPASPARPEKRFELALRLAETVGARVLTGGHIPPEEMPNWMNAADAVVVTSAYEGFGLACLESLACETPVLSTPVGIAPLALNGLDNTLCEPFDLDRWSHFLGDLLDAPDARARGRERVGAFSAERLAERVVLAYREVLDGAPEGFDIRPPVEA